MPWNFHRVLTLARHRWPIPDWTAAKHAALDISMRDWMLGLGLSAEAVRIGYGINTTFGRDASDVSALLMLFRAAFSKEQRRLAPTDQLGFTVEGGVERVPEAMAAALPRPVETGAVVTAIENLADHVRVRLADGRELKARHVICSLPFPVLRQLAIDPPLTGAQAEAVAELPQQPITQVYLAAKRPFWDDDGFAPSLFTDTQAGMVTAVRSGNDPARVSHLSCWVIGPQAERIANLSDADAGSAVIRAIEAIRPAARGQLDYRTSGLGQRPQRGAGLFPAASQAICAGMGGRTVGSASAGSILLPGAAWKARREPRRPSWRSGR
jgi:monoamine oxidase